MTGQLQAQLSRVAALSLLFLLVWLVIGYIVLPFGEDVLGDNEQITSLGHQRDALASLVSRRPSLVDEQKALDRALAGSHMIWSHLSDAEAAARVQGVVRAAMLPDGQISSASEGGVTNDHGLRRISLRFEASSTLTSLTRWVATIEATTPSLSIDRLSVSATPPPDPNRPSYLSIECDLSAFVSQARSR